MARDGSRTGQRPAYLRIYLNDHLAVLSWSTGLARRSLKRHERSTLGAYLQTLLEELQAERTALEALMERCGMPRNRVKQFAASAGEKLGRLKLNGHVLGPSPLSRVVELDSLCAAVDFKLNLWRSLAHLAASDERIAEVSTGRLIERAQAQRAALESHRLEAVGRAFGRPGS